MSKTDYKRPFTVGIFIFVSIAIFIAGIFTIGSRQKLFEKKFNINIVFDDVGGLQPGNNVWLTGVKVGTVKKITFYGADQVAVTVGIEKQAQPRVWKNAKAKISTDGFIGNRIVVIYGGTKEAGPVSDGNYLQSEKNITTDEMIATLQVNNKNLLDITGDFQKIARKLANGEGTIGGLISDNSLLKHLQLAVKNFKAASIKTEDVLNNLSNFSSRLDKQQGLVNQLISDTIIYRDLQETILELKETVCSANEFVDSLQVQSNKLKQQDNTVGLLLNDKETAEDIHQLIKNLKISSVKLDEDLEAIQHNFLFKGYFKKKEKESAY